MAETRQTPAVVPQVTFHTRVRDDSIGGDNPFRWQDVSTEQIFAGKKVIIVALPGAFTPTCSSTHLPEYERRYAEFEQFGVDAVYCLSVNDAFVMYQWGLKLGIKQVKMLPDGNADFTRGMNLLVKKQNLGFGDRSWRYSMLVEDGKVAKIFLEPELSDNCPTDPFEVSDAASMLGFLREQTR